MQEKHIEDAEVVSIETVGEVQINEEASPTGTVVDLSPTDPITPKYTDAEIQRMIEARTTKKQREDALRTHPVEPKDTIGRNDLCMCGSGLKYKKCCGK